MQLQIQLLDETNGTGIQITIGYSPRWFSEPTRFDKVLFDRIRARGWRCAFLHLLFMFTEYYFDRDDIREGDIRDTESEMIVEGSYDIWNE